MVVTRTRKARAARKRKRRMDGVEHDLTDEQWAALRAAWGGCAYCGATDRPLQRDCVLPISRGGRYTLDNIAPACGSCNASKCNDEVTGWLRRKRLDERAFLLRHVEISAALARRFANPRIVHRLSQIAEGSRTKVRLRIVPVALAERAAGRSAEGCAAALAEWIAAEAPEADPRAVLQGLSADLARDVRAWLGL